MIGLVRSQALMGMYRYVSAGLPNGRNVGDAPRFPQFETEEHRIAGIRRDAVHLCSAASTQPDPPAHAEIMSKCKTEERQNAGIKMAGKSKVSLNLESHENYENMKCMKLMNILLFSNRQCVLGVTCDMGNDFGGT